MEVKNPVQRYRQTGGSAAGSLLSLSGTGGSRVTSVKLV
jgi:hypothetical protein